jgi:wyosine [tRNA(Phe)-imidazoG37] synthetase (radical SAM superfamily)
MQRKEYVSVDRVMDELNAYLSDREHIDHITFSGSGEPTLNEGIGEVIRFLKKNYPQYKIALLTNSTLFDQSAVRLQTKHVDVVMASLDAATDEHFKQINRPHPQLDVKRIVDGIAAFRERFTGRLLMEYFVVKGINDSADDLTRMKKLLGRVDADGILINTLDRPAAEAWVDSVSPEKLKEISDFLEDAEIVNYQSVPSRTTVRHDDLEARLVSAVKRRPYTALDVSKITGIDIETLQPVLDQLVATKQLLVKPMERGLFYMIS